MSGRKAKNLNPYKEEILNLISRNKSQQDVVLYLLTAHQYRVSRQTVAKSLQEWTEVKEARTEDTAELRIAIANVYFSAYGIDDSTMLRILQQEGYTITMRGLISIRKELHIYRRTSPNEPQRTMEELVELVNTEFQKGGLLSYGRVHLATYFHQQRCVVPRDRLWQAAKSSSEYAARVEERHRKVHRRRGEFKTPGPDYLWSIDGHMKLEPWGIEIYAATDAYSRHILWIYVGVSTRTKISVLSQYVNALQTTQRKPQIIRSDRGVETTMLADCHLALRRKDLPELRLEDVYFYGTSVKNQRIESFWEQLTGTQLNPWITFFKILSGNNLFDKGDKADRIAFLTVYVPMLRREIFRFMNNWNAHPIRKQRNRPNSIHGVPNVLYYWPEPDVETFWTVPDTDVLEELQRDLELFDPNEYLPVSTLEWCSSALLELGINVEELTQEQEVPPIEIGEDHTAKERLHIVAYKSLRQKLRDHINCGREPILTETTHPIGGINWNPRSELLSQA